MRRAVTISFILSLVAVSSIPLSAAAPIIAINVSSQYSTIYQGESFEIYVIFSNVGSDIASHITVRLVNLQSGFVADAFAKDAGNLAPQAPPGKVTFVLRTSPSISPSTYQINVQVSADNASPQLGSTSVEVLQSPIIISVLNPSVSIVQVDKPQTFNVLTKVDSVAQLAVGGLTLTLLVDTSAFSVLSGPVPPPPQTLAPQGSTGILNYTLSTLAVSTPGYRNISLVVGFGTADGRTHAVSRPTSVFFKHWYDPATFGCLIVTATYGSELAPEVQVLRVFRDKSILKTAAGSSFMIVFNAWYYSFSPTVAGYLAGHWVARTIMKGVLYPLIGMLYLTSALYTVTSKVPEFAVLLSGLLASTLIGAFYLGLPLVILRAKVRRLRGHRLGRVLAFGLLSAIAALLIGECFASETPLMLSSTGVVLLTIFLSATQTSEIIMKILERH
jgi:hypothetical protein